MQANEHGSIRLFVDDAAEPYATFQAPATVDFDTSSLSDGPHVLHVEAVDAMGKVGRRAVAFDVQNGPGITVNGLRAGERIAGTVTLEINAFSGDVPFDPVRAESSAPVPVWTGILAVLVAAWAVWYGIAEFQTPPPFAATPTYEANPVALAAQPAQAVAPPSYSGKGSAGGFDYAKTGPALYAQNCAACHGAAGAGVPGAFPPLARDPVVSANDPQRHIAIVLHGLHGAKIAGTAYASQMPPFAQLSDDEIAAIVDHERTSWGNNAPLATPADVKRGR